MSLEVGKTYNAPVELQLRASRFEMCGFTVVSVPGNAPQGDVTTSSKASSEEATLPVDGDD
jgi:hypothetical protein